MEFKVGDVYYWNEYKLYMTIVSVNNELNEFVGEFNDAYSNQECFDMDLINHYITKGYLIKFN